MKSFVIKSKIKDFKVNFVDDYKFIKELTTTPNYMIIVGKNVYALYKEKLFNKIPKENLLVINFDEERKSMKTILLICDKLLNKSAKKNLTIISFGGGINQDVSGFVASTLYRGVNWIYIPTTLLAMADSAIGLKTSLNLKKYKNVLGTFYPPSEIFINVDFLDTLNTTDYTSGIGEIVKLLLMDESAFTEPSLLSFPRRRESSSIKTQKQMSYSKKIDQIHNKTQILRERKNKKNISQIIEETMKIKLSYMEGDEFDKGKRNLLNYGHEFGHALEPASSYIIPHGIAVMIGIIFANYISLKRGILEKKTYNEINKKLLLPNILGSNLKFEKKFFNEKDIIENMKKDKKRISKELVLVMPQKDLRLTKINDLAIDEIHDGIIELVKELL